jgi:4-nitrophenyl phosphatase
MNNRIRALFLDMDGVLWKDLIPIGDLAGNIAQIRELGLDLAFITNNATRSREHYSEIFDSFDIHVGKNQIYTSATATAVAMAAEWPDGGSCFVIGEAGLHEALNAKGFTHSATKNPLAVVVGLDRQLTYEKLTQATLFIREGVKFIGTNPDSTIPTPAGLAPGAGSIISALETSSGQKATIIGKPQTAMLNQALSDLNVKADQVIMVGDRLETDIAAGQNAGCNTALVHSGASSHADLANWSPTPDFVADDLTDLIGQLSNE